MKIFVDSAELDEIKTAFSWGIVDGVTTNPSLIKKAVDAAGKGIDMKDYIKKILETAGKGFPVSLEVIGLSEKDMYEQALKLYKMFNPLAGNVVIKIPFNPAFEENSDTKYDGLKVISKLAEKNIPVNCTLIFTPEQGLLAAKAGAKYISPFAGRIDDYIRKNAGVEFEKPDYYPAEGVGGREDNGIVSGVQLVAECVDILETYEMDCEVIAASLRNPRQVRECAFSGSHIGTIPFKVIEAMLQHEKTAEGVKKFTEDIVPEYSRIFK